MEVWQLRIELNDIKNAGAKIGILDEDGNICDIHFVWSEKHQAYLFGEPN